MPHLRSFVRCALALLTAALVQPSMAGPVLERIKSGGQVVIAHRESSVPFSFVDPDGKPVGYAVDLCLKLVDALRRQLAAPDLKPRFVMVTPANRIVMIEEGKADLECGSTTNNAERRQKVAFTVPHYIAGARYLVRADSPVDVIRDFKGRTVVSTKGTTPLKAVTQANNEYQLGIRVVEAPDHARAVDMVAAAEADGFAMDDVLLYGLVAGRPDPAKFKVVGKFLTIEPLAIMFSRDDAEFKKLVDDEMKRLIQTREAHAVYERWFLKAIPPANRSLNLPMNYLLKDFWKYPTDQVPG
ncbi:amino acid ABC transporter substrate-binding protein [Hydrogenophaga pseudoflava]|uniref:amino acid ABC transporter substrate-binding protein n=1 Tax=Hydrogenophaga pseudoflava TaxID=47421 RepID=UPI0035B49122